MDLRGNWNYPTSIRFGAGRIRELPEACRAVGLRRPLLVTDPGLAKLPMIADAMVALRKSGIEVALFSDVKPKVGALVKAWAHSTVKMSGARSSCRPRANSSRRTRALSD